MAAAPADDGHTTGCPIWRRTFAQQRQPSSRSPAPAMTVARTECWCAAALLVTDPQPGNYVTRQSVGSVSIERSISSIR
eukprot:3779024-Prymnesium_polylepis.1